MRDFNIDLAFECVKNICESIKCGTCDKLIGPCVRFPCGHSVCKDCAENAGECLYCISSSTGSYFVDDPQTTRFLNASSLLTAFQDVFKIDEYKRRRISDHLKLEKQVFPECIQAPNKYCNKRKSSIVSAKNKQNFNLSILPGEEITGTDTVKMKKSLQYVQNWLNQLDGAQQNVPRKPFGDINVNTQLSTNKLKKNISKPCNMKTQMNPKMSTYRKRSHFKSISNSSLLNDIHNMRNNTPVTQMNELVKKCKSFTRYKYDRNESGIVIDDDSIVEESAALEIIDKDKLACLAILEAAKKDECSIFQIEPESEFQNRDPYDNPLIIDNRKRSASEENVTKPQNVIYNFKKVSFYKKSSLLEMCKQCDQYISYHTSLNCKVKNNDVSIVVNSSGFVTTIKFMQSNQRKYDKNSVAIQTDNINDPLQNKIFDNGKISSHQKRKKLLGEDVIPAKTIKSDVAVQSLDVFTTNKSDDNTNVKSNDCENFTKHVWNESAKLSKCVVIEDSDTASNSSNDNSLIHEVVAEVHRTNAPNPIIVQRGVLTTLSKSEYQQRSMPPFRGQARNSSDSSDKENLDPNRRKHPKFGKKHKNKK